MEFVHLWYEKAIADFFTSTRAQVRPVWNPQLEERKYSHKNLALVPYIYFNIKSPACKWYPVI